MSYEDTIKLRRAGDLLMGQTCKYRTAMLIAVAENTVASQKGERHAVASYALEIFRERMEAITDGTVRLVEESQ